MKILQLHNRYGSGMGGEDVVVDLEKGLLERNGHDVHQLFVSNDSLSASGLRVVAVGVNAVWSSASARLAKNEIERIKPDIVHVHNTFAVLSPSIFSATKSTGVPVVHSLHNWRFTCATSCLFRDGRICTDCVGRFPIKALARGCGYTGSRGVGAVIAATQALHGILGTYRRNIDGFIVFSEFQRKLAISAGIPSDKIFVKPHFIPDPVPDVQPAERARQIVFVGLLVDYKGVDLLLNAWRMSNRDGWTLKIIGDGPMFAQLSESYRQNDIVFAGKIAREDVLREIAASRWLAMPSRLYETFGMSVAESLALGTPVIVPNHAHFPEMAADGESGLHFEANNAESLSGVLSNAIRKTDESWQAFSTNARNAYLSKYTPELNYPQLVAIYEKLIG